MSFLASNETPGPGALAAGRRGSARTRLRRLAVAGRRLPVARLRRLPVAGRGLLRRSRAAGWPGAAGRSRAAAAAGRTRGRLLPVAGRGLLPVLRGLTARGRLRRLAGGHRGLSSQSDGCARRIVVAPRGPAATAARPSSPVRDHRRPRRRRCPATSMRSPGSGADERRRQPPTISRMSCAVSDGVLPTRTPAASRASCLACAVPDEPETMAPAWPIVLPSGAVKPAT